MTVTYRQIPINVLRAAKEGDPGFDASGGDDQILIKDADGSDIVVTKDQLSGMEPPKAAPQAALQMHPSKPEENTPRTFAKPKFK